MIIKGKARGRADQLSAHLLRQDTNEVVEIREIQGVVSQDVPGALEEMEALAAAMRSRRPLYHGVISPAADRPFTPEQLSIAIDRLEKSLELEGQPRLVISHEKKGRQHHHIVWARTDLEHGRAIPDSWNYMRHEKVARELEREFGHERVQGALAERGDRPRPRRTPSLAEMHQSERAGITPKEVTTELTKIWQASESGREFRAAIEYVGYQLAQGDQRAFVVIDAAGEVHALARRIEGAKTKDVRAKLSDIDSATLPTVEQARTVAKEQLVEMRESFEAEQRFERAALESAQARERTAAEERRRSIKQHDELYAKIREQREAKLAATLYYSGDYVSMSGDARKHVANKIRNRESSRRSVSLRFWQNQLSGWQEDRQRKELARLDKFHARERQPILEAERRLNNRLGPVTPPASAPDDSPRPEGRSRKQREMDDMFPVGELSDSQRANVDRAIDRATPLSDKTDRSTEKTSTSSPSRDPGGGGRER